MYGVIFYFLQPHLKNGLRECVWPSYMLYNSHQSGVLFHAPTPTQTTVQFSENVLVKQLRQWDKVDNDMCVGELQSIEKEH
jgi:hypothetical protein